jgi:hypothetical protein
LSGSLWRALQGLGRHGNHALHSFVATARRFFGGVVASDSLSHGARPKNLVVLYGAVLPKSLKFGLTFPHAVAWQSNSGLTAHLTPRIKDGDVEIECLLSTDEPTLQDLADVFDGAYTLLATIVNLHVFATGGGMTVYLDEVLRPGESKRVGIRRGEERCVGLCTAFDPMQSGEIWKFVFGDPQLNLIFNDLAMALQFPAYQQIACGRAIDGMRVYLSPDEEPQKGWIHLRKELNVSRKYVDYVWERASEARHRERFDFPANENSESMRRTWVLINRFLEYCLAGKVALSVPKYPLLEE